MTRLDLWSIEKRRFHCARPAFFHNMQKSVSYLDLFNDFLLYSGYINISSLLNCFKKAIRLLLWSERGQTAYFLFIVCKESDWDFNLWDKFHGCYITSSSFRCVMIQCRALQQWHCSTFYSALCNSASNL